MPIRRGRTVTDATQELQPGQLRRRFARSGPGFAFCDKLNSPRVGGGLSHDQWQWCLGKLEECASVGVSGDEQFSRDFRRILPRSPDGLATLNAPAGLSEIYCRKRRHRATRTQRVKRKGDGEKQNKIPLRERNLFVHGPADRTCFTKLHGNQARNFCAASAGGSLALRPYRVESARFTKTHPVPLPMKRKHPTSNIQRRTPNGSANPRSLRRSMFGVGRSMFSRALFTTGPTPFCPGPDADRSD